MRILRYVVVLLLVAAVGMIAATPWMVGNQYKTQYMDLIQSANQRSPVKLELVQYQTGYLSSDAVLRMDLNAPGEKKPNPNAVLTINQHIIHGPLVKDADGNWVPAYAMIQSQVHVASHVEAVMLGANAAAGIMQVETVVSFDGHYKSQVKMPAFTLKSTDGSKLSWQGMSGTLDATVVGDQLQHLLSQFASGAIALQSDSGNFSIPSLKSQGERSCETTGLCSGSSTLSMPSLDGLYNNQNVKLTGVDLKAQYGKRAGNAYSMNANFALAQLVLPDYSIGPASVKLAFNNLNADALEKMIRLSRAVADVQGDDQQAQRMALFAEYNNEIPHLITAGTELTEDTSIATSYGNFTSAARLSWPANTPLPASTDELLKMNVKLDMRAAAKLVDQVVMVLDNEFNADLIKAQADAAAALPVAPKPKPVAPATPPVPKVSPTAAFARQLLQPYVDQHKLQPDVIKAIIELQEQHLSKVVYDIAVDKIILIQILPRGTVKKLAQELKDNYAQNYLENAAEPETDVMMPAMPGDTTASTAPAVATPAPAPTPAPEMTLRQQLDAYVQHGMILRDKDDYVVALDYENGVLTVNGKTVPVPMPVPAP